MKVQQLLSAARRRSQTDVRGRRLQIAAACFCVSPDFRLCLASLVFPSLGLVHLIGASRPQHTGHWMFLDRAHGQTHHQHRYHHTHQRGTATCPRTGQRWLDDAGGLMLMQTDAVILILFSHMRLISSFQWPLFFCVRVKAEGERKPRMNACGRSAAGLFGERRKQLVCAGASLQPCTERMSSSCFLSFG